MSTDDNIAAQEHLAENVNSGNIDAAVESFAVDAVDHDPAPAQGPGRDGFKAFFTELRSAFPDAHIEPAHMVADEDNVAHRLHAQRHPSGRLQRRGADRQEDRGQRDADRSLRERADRRALGLQRRTGILQQLGVNPTGD